MLSPAANAKLDEYEQYYRELRNKAPNWAVEFGAGVVLSYWPAHDYLSLVESIARLEGLRRPGADPLSLTYAVNQVIEQGIRDFIEVSHL